MTIIIVSYETREMTLTCIRSVLEQTQTIRYKLIGWTTPRPTGRPRRSARAFPT